MNIRKLESLTKEEPIELVKQEREHIADAGKMVPEGFKLVPVEPTYEMHIAARDWSIGEHGGAMGSDASGGCYKAMLAAAPTIKQSLTAEPTDSEMLDWVVDNWQTVEYTEDKGIFEVWTATCRYEGKTARDAISKAMRGEE